MSKLVQQGIYHVIGGGTVNHIRSHFGITATAYGGTARAIHNMLVAQNINAALHLTKMACAGQSKLETNDDIANLVEEILADENSRAIFFNPAITDFNGKIGDIESGKYSTRLKSREAKDLKLALTIADKIVPNIKQQRPDIFLVAFKTTTHASKQDQYEAGLGLLKGSGSDLILANDTGTRNNMVITKDGFVLLETHERTEALTELVAASLKRIKAAPTPKTKQPQNKPS